MASSVATAVLPVTFNTHTQTCAQHSFVQGIQTEVGRRPTEGQTDKKIKDMEADPSMAVLTV